MGLLRHHRFQYVLTVALAVAGLGAIAIYVVEGGRDAAVGSLGDALWWGQQRWATVTYLRSREERAAMAEFACARHLRQAGLPTIDAGVNLQKGEVCHHVTRGAILRKTVVRSYTRGGQKFKEEGFVVEKEGDVYVTSTRVLVVGDGTSSIPHEKVLGIEIDHDDKVVQVTRDGRQKPIYVSIRDAVHSGTMIDMLSEVATS